MDGKSLRNREMIFRTEQKIENREIKFQKSSYLRILENFLSDAGMQTLFALPAICHLTISRRMYSHLTDRNLGGKVQYIEVARNLLLIEFTWLLRLKAIADFIAF